MSTQEEVKGWKAAAYAAISKYYAIEAERSSFEERLDAAKAEAEKLGVQFDYGSPRVEATNEALRCPCGTIIPLDYDARRLPRQDGILHCAPCRTKTAAAVQADAKEEGRALPAQAVAKRAEEVPF